MLLFAFIFFPAEKYVTTHHAGRTDSLAARIKHGLTWIFANICAKLCTIAL
jgi:hypothetical protein